LDHEAQADQQLGPGGLALAGREVVVHAHGQREGNDQQGHAQAIDQHGAKGVEQAAQGRADDDGELHAAGAQRDGARQQRTRHQQRGDGLLCRHLEGAGQTQANGQGQDAVAAHVVRPGAQHQHRGHAALDGRCAGKDAGAVPAVGKVAAGQGHHQRGHKLEEAHQAQVPGVAGQVVHVPAQRHHQHLVGHDAGQTCQPETLEGALRPQLLVM